MEARTLSRLPDSCYRLIDSGEGEKLEQFGEYLLRRPSAQCVWKKHSANQWQKADAAFQINSGWKRDKGVPESWSVNFYGIRFIVRLLQNGQVGLFPEHLLYLPSIGSFIKEVGAKDIKVLNLFAYTGAATVYCASLGAEVTHVDLAKQALTWTREALVENDEKLISKVRFIKDDAVQFLKREIKRKKSYNVVICDPPSFSRVSKDNFWKAGDMLSSIVKLCTEVLDQSSRSALIITSHSPEVSFQMLENLGHDYLPEHIHASGALLLEEASTQRKLPSGVYLFSQR